MDRLSESTPPISGRERGSILAGIGQASLLMAVAALPAWCSKYSSFGFEPDKSRLLVLLAFTSLGATLVGGRALYIRSGVGTSVGRISTPAAIGLMAVLISILLSAVLSIQPAWSWWGSPHRAWGVLTPLALLATAWVTISSFRDAQSRRLLVRAIVLSSIPVVVIGLWQGAGWPSPTLWRSDHFAGRPFSTLGNPLFLGSYLILTIPYTIVVAAGKLSRRKSTDIQIRATTIITILLLALQLLVLFLTRARGAWVGLAGGMLFVLLAVALRRGQRRAAVGGASLLLILLIGILLLTSATHFDARLGNSSFGQLFDPTGSGRQRLKIWNELVHHLAGGRAPFTRLFVGYGPDTQMLILPNQLTYRAQRGDLTDHTPLLLDRSHNIILDSLLTRGILGLAAQVVLLITAIWVGLRQMGQRVSLRFLVAGGLAGMASMGLLAWLLTKDIGLLPMAVGLGVGVGLVIASLAGTLRHPIPRHVPLAEKQLLVLAALGALFGYWIDLQFGFETQAASLLAWIALALLISHSGETGHTSRRGSVHLVGAKHSNTVFTRYEMPLPNASPLLLASGAILIAGLLGAGLQAGIAPLLSVFAIWLTCGILCGLWCGARALSSYPLLSLGPMLLVMIGAKLFDNLLAGHQGWPAVGTTVIAWFGVLLCAGAAGWHIAGEARPRTPFKHIGVALISLFIGLLGIGFVIRPALGDILTHQGSLAARGGGVNDAVTLLETAVIWGPHDTPPYDMLSQLWLLRARTAQTAPIMEDAYSHAAGAMDAAWHASPYQAELGRRLAWVYREWADQTIAPDQRLALLRKATEALELAASIAPADQRIRDDLEHTRQLLTEGETS